MDLKINAVNFNIPFKAVSLRPNFEEGLQEGALRLKTLERDTFVKQKPQQFYSLTERKLIIPKKGQIQDPDGIIFTRGTTSMFRDDMDWYEFAKYLKRRFQGGGKVNTYAYACSTGSEPFTLSILLQNTFKENSKRFFPIIARDIDETTIERAKNRQQNPRTSTNNSHFLAKRILNIDEDEIKKYYTKLEDDCPFESIMYLTDAVKKPIQFEQGNILEDIDKIDSKNPSIVMMRNMWPYVDPKEYKDFAAKLYKKLAPGSIVVLGDYDYTGEKGRRKSGTFPKTLIHKGFVPYKSKEFKQKETLIFEKN